MPKLPSDCMFVFVKLTPHSQVPLGLTNGVECIFFVMIDSWGADWKQDGVQ